MILSFTWSLLEASMRLTYIKHASECRNVYTRLVYRYSKHSFCIFTSQCAILKLMQRIVFQEYPCYQSKRTRKGPGLPEIFSTLSKYFECQQPPLSKNQFVCWFQGEFSLRASSTDWLTVRCLIGCRSATVGTSSDTTVVSFTFPSEPIKDAAYPLHFNRTMTNDDAHKKLVSYPPWIRWPAFIFYRGFPGGPCDHSPPYLPERKSPPPGG